MDAFAQEQGLGNNFDSFTSFSDRKKRGEMYLAVELA